MAISLEKVDKWEKKKKAKKLLHALYDNSVEIRIRVIQALGSIEDPEIMNQLVNLLRDPLPDIRQATLNTLGKIGSGRASEFIRFMLEHEKDEKVIEAGRAALVAIKEKVQKEEQGIA